MGELKIDFSKRFILWGHTDIMEKDLEMIEFNKNYGGENEAYSSILDEETVYPSIMNFTEDEGNALYAEEVDEDDEDASVNQPEEDSAFENRDSYRDTDHDNVYYLI